MIELRTSNAHLAPFREAIAAALANVNVDDPAALGILCNGSVPTGAATDASDVDLCVCWDAPVSRFLRKTFDGKAVDLHWEDARWMRTAKPPYDPSALFMLAHAEVMWERTQMLSPHVAAATRQFQLPAPKLAGWQQFHLMIDCSTRLQRVAASQGQPNFYFLLGGLLERTVEAALRLNRKWYLDTGHGVRDLQVFLPDKAAALSRIGSTRDTSAAVEGLRGYLSDLFGVPMPLEEWDSGEIRHDRVPWAKR